MALIVFVIAAGICMVLFSTVFFNIEHITVTGSSNYTYDEIIKASRIAAGDNLIRTNTEKASEHIERELVYIENAVIKRSFPSTLIIDIEPSVPAANFICEKSILLISEGGKVLDRIEEPKAGLFNFTGTEPMPGILPGDMFRSEDEHKTEAVNQLLAYCVKTQDENITAIDVTNRSEITYTYQDRINVKIGSINDLDYKMSFSEEIISTKISDTAEGILTILSDSNRASFLDKETLEHNEQVFMENSPANTEDGTLSEEEEGENEEASSESTSAVDPYME